MIYLILIIMFLANLSYFLFLTVKGYGASFEWIWIMLDVGIVVFALIWRSRKVFSAWVSTKIHPLLTWSVILLFCAGIIFFIVIEALIIYYGTLKPTEEVDYLIVLGAKVNASGNPSLMLKLRLDATIDYVNEHLDTMIIVSGGQGIDEPMSEALAMKKYLVARGIDDSRILMEDQSTSTLENATFSLELIPEPKNEHIIGIVSNNFHIMRARSLFKHLGYTVESVSAPSVYYMVPHYYLREVAAYTKEWINGSVR